MKLLSSFILVIVIAGFYNYPHIPTSPKKRNEGRSRGCSAVCRWDLNGTWIWYDENYLKNYKMHKFGEMKISIEM